MASKSLGTLTLDLVAKIGGYVDGLTKAERASDKFAKDQEKRFKQMTVSAQATGEALGRFIADGAYAVGRAFAASLSIVSDFQDLAEKTGASAEGLASFAVAAGTAGTSMDEIANASVKLTKNLTGVDDESKAAGAALAFLGLNIKEFKDLAPEDQMEQFAKALGQVDNSADQVALAIDAFGKSGAQLIPFFKALNEQGGRQVILTKQMIEQADAYADAQAKALTELKLYAGVLSAQALPAITDFTKALSDTAKEIIGLDKDTAQLKSNNGVQSFAEAAVDSLAFVVDAANGVRTVFSRLGEFIGATAAAMVEKAKGNAAGVKAIQDAYAESLGTSQFKSMRDQVRLAREERKKMEALARSENRGFTPTSGRTYEGKTTGGGGRRGGGKDPTAEAQRYIENLQKQLEKTQELTVAEQALQDIQMGRLGQVTTAQKEQILNTAAQVDALKEQKKQEEQFKKYQAAVEDVNSKLLEMQGLTAEAAAIKFDRENSALYTLFSEQGDEAMKGKLDLMKQMTVAAAQFAKEQQNIGKVQSDLDRAESRIQRDIELGVSGQLDGLKKLGEARQKALAGMQQSYSEFQKLQASGVQFTSDQIRSMEQLKDEIEDLSTRLDPLAEKFNNMFGEKFADALTSVIDGTKTLKAALKDLVNSFVQDLVKLAAQDVAKSFFGGGGSATGGVGVDFGSILSSLFAGARANGGPVMPNSLYRVNENGPELFQAANGSQYLMTGNEQGKVLPNAGGMNQTVNVNIVGTPDPRTPTQIAQEVRRQTNTASRRFG